MPGIARQGKDSAGGTIVAGSANVFANNSPDARVGDAVAGHGKPPHAAPVMAAGSPNVFSNNIPTSRAGDAASCGHTASGSDDVFVNEPGENLGGVFVPENPYQAVFVKKIVAEAGGNAPHDDPDSTVISYGLGEDTAPVPVDETKPADDTPGKVDAGEPTACGDFKVDPVDYDQKLSTNFAISNFTLKTLWVHKLEAQNGLSVADIICNLKGLAENILEPLAVKYPGFRINSGFRKGTGTSQHNRGMACDLQWPGLSPAGYTPIANWIRDNLPFDQLIFEHGNNIWLHISYNRTASKQRNQLLTYYPKVTPNYKPGLTNYYA